jgi:hypothetical protein
MNVLSADRSYKVKQCSNNEDIPIILVQPKYKMPRFDLGICLDFEGVSTLNGHSELILKFNRAITLA